LFNRNGRRKEKMSKITKKEMRKTIRDSFKDMDKAFIKEWTPKTRSYEKDCIHCKMWKLYDKFKKEAEEECLIEMEKEK